MYRKSSKDWTKHLDFIVLDMICLQVAYFMAYLIRHGNSFPFDNQLYRDMIFVFCFSQVFVSLVNDSFKNILRRGYYHEFTASVRHVGMIILLSVLYLFSTRESSAYSRIVVALTGIFYVAMTWTVRCFWKKILAKRGTDGKVERTLILLTTKSMASELIRNFRENNYGGLRLIGIALMNDVGKKDAFHKGMEIEGVPVVADAVSMADYVCKDWVDEVFISLPREVELPDALYDELVAMGVTVHLRLLRAMKSEGQKQSVERLGNYTVLSSSINMAPAKQFLYKRLLDILGGTVGCLATAVLYIFIAPLIYIQSPGPIFFSQERVGMNGRKFRIYKFRSMYMDAEERKQELMKQNKVKDGMMFKMDNDPRIIGGEHGIGGIIRRFSLDEFPQFWNVLKGDMSLVGTRPPTVEEWKKYDLHHRVRLATKPGITGMWQVSGRSGITDFEEVVRLDKKYIMEWSMGLDLRILFRTVGAVLRSDGAM